MTFSDAHKGQIENEYKCIKESDSKYQYPAATFTLEDSNWSSEQLDNWRLAKEAREKTKHAEYSIRYNNSLSPTDRNYLYQQILDYLPLDSEALELRGFSNAEIASCEFKKVQKWQSLPFAIPDQLPGIGKDGKSLIVGGDGFLCPIRNYDGQVTAIQLRLSKADDAGRYRWLSGNGQVLPLQVGSELENPLAVFKVNNATGIALVEGTGVKPYLASKRLNKLVIGASGGQFTASPMLLREYLDRASKDLDTKLVTIYPDAGDIENSAVMNRWEQLNTLLLQLGYTIQFAWWRQFTKEAKDIDELDINSTEFSYLSFAQFKALGSNSPTKNQTNLLDIAFQRWINHRKFTPTITVNQPELKIPLEILENNAILSIKSGMGTGKTNGLLEQIKNSSNRAFIFGCLNNLLLDTIGRAMNLGIKIYHLHEDDAKNLIPDINTHIACCVDSIHHLDGYFTGIDLYIDEICSVIAHIVSGGTLKGRQGLIMKIFEKAVREANRVFILDANNNDLVTDFIGKIDPSKKVIKIANLAQVKGHHFKFVDGYNPEKEKTLKRDKSPLLKMMLDKDCKPWIASDSKEFTNTISELLADEDKQGYTLNRDTVSEDWAKNFLTNPTEFISLHSPDYFAISPTANSGVSITDIGSFNTKISVFTGVLSTNHQSQILMRLRPSLPHYIACPEFSTIDVDSSIKTPNEYRKKVLDKIILSSFISNSDDNLTQAQLLASAILDKGENDIWFHLSGELGWIDNFERQHLRKCLIYALQEQGHTTEIINLESSKQHNEQYKETKDKIVERKAEQLLVVEPFQDIDEANQIAKGNPNKSTMLRVEKTRLLDRLPGIDTSQSWDAELIKYFLTDKEAITKHQRFWMLNNFEVSQKRSEANWFYNVTSEYFYLGSMDKDAHLKVWAMKELGIPELVQKLIDGHYLYKNTPEVVSIYEKALTDSEIHAALGIHIRPATESASERMRLVRQIFESVGIKLKTNQRKLIDGIRQVTYTLDTEAYESQARVDVLNCIETKYSGYLLSETVKKVKWEDERQQHSEEIYKPELNVVDVGTNELDFSLIVKEERQQHSEEIYKPEINVTDADANEPDSSLIQGTVELFREFLVDGTLTWDMVVEYFEEIDEEAKKLIWESLTLGEQSQIRMLKSSTA
ncbi:plasmid replication protein, CyRepA1 family [uncultured Nostoc sp.]|uniref:plasmid replication protein, CyRepA1 family n=1 Tax=uncultured Nostoc sp. TaxID=340711 RepID=UPI0035CB46FC